MMWILINNNKSFFFLIFLFDEIKFDKFVAVEESLKTFKLLEALRSGNEDFFFIH